MAQLDVVQASGPMQAGDFQSYQTLALDMPHFAGKTFTVLDAEGDEAISQPYLFTVNFTCTEVLDGPGAIGTTATVSVNFGKESFIASGVILRFRNNDPTPLGDYSYLVQIGPHFALLDLSSQNQVYGTVNPITVPGIITGKLTNQLSQKSTSGGDNILIDHELRLSGGYPARANVVQFDETDMNFVQRSCENAGVFYFFEHSAGKDTVVFGDANVAFKSSAVPGQGASESLPFRMTRGVGNDVAVSSFIMVSRTVPQKIYLRDYDDTQAGTNLLASTTVDSNGIGAFVEYGQKFTSVDEGNQLAKIRAQEQIVKKTSYNGASTASQLRPGFFFNLADHPNSNMNGKYVVTSAHHQAGAAGSPVGPYQNTFVCIKFETDYRPPRVTPKPVAAGLYNATIDSASSGERADIDDVGRYKIRQVYDESNSPAGHASTYVREAQPYAGKNDTGFHFPLLKDTEVVVAYINGDPDRPVIVGAIPNSLTPAVSVLNNNVINRFRTPSGALFEMNDGGGMVSDPPYVRIISETVGGTDYSNSSYVRLGANLSSDEGSLTPSSATVTSSTVSQETFTSSQDYLTNSLSSAAAKGQLTTAQLQGNTATANLSKASVSYTNRTPLTKGIMMYSDGDLQINTVGAAYMQFGQGHATVVATGDATYNVSAGVFTVKAQHGVSITAGAVPTTAETLVGGNTAAGDAAGQAAGTYSSGSDDPAAGSDAATKAGTSATASSAPADLYLWAANNINQKAFGPQSEVTYGDSYKNVQGNTTDIFSGTYYKETHGTLTQHLYADTTNYNHQNTNTTTYGNSISTTFGSSISTFTGAVLSTKIDIELNTVIGMKIDILLGVAIKLVPILDMGVLGLALKICFVDMKFAITDTKTVVVDSKSYAVEMKNGVIKESTTAVACNTKALSSGLGVMKTDIKALVAKIRGNDTTV